MTPASPPTVLPALLRLAVPIVIGNLLQTGYQIIDAFWVGRLGAAAVAAVSVSFPIMFLMIALSAGFGVAGATLSAQYWGAGNRRMVDRVAGQTMLMVGAVSVVLAALGIFAAPSVLRLIGVAPEVYAGGLGFLRVSFAGLPFVFGFAMYQALMRGVGQATAPLWIVLGTVVLNFALDPLFIFGWGPLPGAGVMGAAMATLSTQALACVLAGVLLVGGSHGIRVGLAELKPDFAYIRRAFLLGFPSSVELSARALGLAVMSLLVTGFGTTILAAYGVGSNVLQVVTIPAMGLAAASSALAGQSIGAGEVDRAARITTVAAAIGFGALTVAGAFAWVFAPTLVAFFVPGDPAVIAEGARFVRITSPAWGFIALQLTIVSAFRAAGSTLVAMVLALVAQWILQFPLAFVLSRPQVLGDVGLWWAFPASNVLTAAVAYVWYARGDWKTKRLT